MYPVVISELHKRYPVNPIILVVIDIKPEVLFQLLVDPFGLTICLWVVSRGWVVLNTQVLAEADCKLGLELWTG